MKKIIYSNFDCNFEEAKKEYKVNLLANDYSDEYIKKMLENDDNIYRYIDEMNYQNFEDEKLNLSKKIDYNILVVANLGLWQGQTSAYKILDSGNLNEILFSFGGNCDFIEFFAENRKVFGKGTHHDGTNFVEFRKIKNGLSQLQYDKLLDSIYYNKDAEKYIKKYTASIYKEIKEIYGW